MCNASVSFHVLPAAKQKSREGREGPKAVLQGCAFPGSFAGPRQPEDLLQCWELFYHCLSLQLNLLRKVILCPNPHPGLSLRKMVRVGQGLFFLGSCQHRAQSSARGASLQVPGQRCARVCPGPVQSPHCSCSSKLPVHSSRDDRTFYGCWVSGVSAGTISPTLDMRDAGKSSSHRRGE